MTLTYARTGYRGHRRILALLAVLAGLAGCAATAAVNQEQLGPVSWPGSGTSAADIAGAGVKDGPGANQQVPIASVAKLMTAYVILRDHPLSSGDQGPQIMVEPSEAAAYPSQVRAGDSLVPVTAGEEISERQALEALLLPSADNMAWILARWDIGSQSAFVARMNTAARALGMTGTHYTDPSGLASSTASTAADQVRLGMAAMNVPALAAITAMPSAAVPVAGTVSSTDTLLGQDGIVGLKTGNTQAAGGCFLAAAREEVNGRDILIVTATFGQPGAGAAAVTNALRAGHDLVLSVDHSLSAGSPSGRPSSSGDRSRTPSPTATRNPGSHLGCVAGRICHRLVRR